MPSYKVFCAVPCDPSGMVKYTVINALLIAQMKFLTEPALRNIQCDFFINPGFPTNVTRNQLVAGALERNYDFLVMLDSDSAPNTNFIPRAIWHLIQNPCSIIGAPYCGTNGPNNSHIVNVFEWVSLYDEASPNKNFDIKHISREESARRHNIELCANIGTHTICYDLKVFSKIKKPYFHYNFDLTEETVLETEDTWCHHSLSLAGVKIFVDWECWSGHWKNILIEKPLIVGKKDLDVVFLKEAYAYLQDQLYQKYKYHYALPEFENDLNHIANADIDPRVIPTAIDPETLLERPVHEIDDERLKRCYGEKEKLP